MATKVVFEKTTARISESDLTPVANAVTVTDLSLNHPHNFFAVQFFDSNGGRVAATGGTIVFDVFLMTSKAFEPPPGNTVEAATPETVSVEGNIRAVRATPTGILTATQYKVVVCQNRS